MQGTPGILERRGLEREQARRVDLDRHVGELPLNRLIARDRRSERFAIGGVLERSLERGASDPDRLRGDSDPAAVQRFHRDLEALALGADQILARHAQIIEADLRAVRGVDSHLVFDPRHAPIRAHEYRR